jgi:hypothetical protein
MMEQIVHLFEQFGWFTIRTGKKNQWTAVARVRLNNQEDAVLFTSEYGGVVKPWTSKLGNTFYFLTYEDRKAVRIAKELNGLLERHQKQLLLILELGESKSKGKPYQAIHISVKNQRDRMVRDMRKLNAKMWSDARSTDPTE